MAHLKSIRSLDVGEVQLVKFDYTRTAIHTERGEAKPKLVKITLNVDKQNKQGKTNPVIQNKLKVSTRYTMIHCFSETSKNNKVQRCKMSIKVE